MRMPSSTLWLAHEQPRQGQIEMIDDALESLQEGKIFLAAAPTGIGKTAAALASCIDFASQDLLEAAALPSLFLIFWSTILILLSSKYILSKKN